MWNYKQLGILPNQYHYSYENGDTLIYPEHIRDIAVIDTMVSNKHKADAEKQKAESERKSKKSGIGSGAGGKGVGKQSQGFYGHTFRFDNN